jgi:carbon storage regulator
MLILSRRPGEKIILYTDEGLKIVLTALERHTGQMRIGVDAPVGVHVDREEIYIRKLEQAKS